METETEFNQYSELANAIVLQACSDYFTCKRMISKRNKNNASRINDCKQLLKECIDFFHSDEYRLYTRDNETLAPTKVIARLDAMVNDEKSFPNDYSPFRYGKEEN